MYNYPLLSAHFFHAKATLGVSVKIKAWFSPGLDSGGRNSYIVQRRRDRQEMNIAGAWREGWTAGFGA